MDLLALLAALDAGPARIIRHGGRLRLIGPADARTEIRAAVIAHRDLLAWHLHGRATGHALGFCTTCAEPSMVAVKRTTWPTCRMTPGCTGRHQPRPSKQCLFGPGLDYPPIRPTNREQP